MSADRLRNQRRLIDEELLANTSFTVIGAGAIGSFTCLCLAKMGAKKIVVYDHDKIEDHNIANQMYPVEHIGRSKVDALQLVCLSYGQVMIDKKNEKWNPLNAIDSDIVISAVDNMDVRKQIWDYYKTRPIKFFVEGRMGAMLYRTYGVDPQNQEAVKFYETTLYPQSEAAPERCGEKSIIFTVLAVSHMIVNQIKQFLMKEYRPTEVIGDIYNATNIAKYHEQRSLEVIEAN